jgi:signal recognition particle GTPase
MDQLVKTLLSNQFTAATEVTSLAVTKLDGTAKGGVVIVQISLRFL